MGGRVRYGVLGPIEVRDDGRTVEVRPGKQRALLAALLLAPNEVVSTDVLIDDLWGAEPPAGAGASLHALVSHLRRLIEPGRSPGDEPSVLVTRPPGYVLRVQPEEIDSACFERLAAEGAARLKAEEPEAGRDLLVKALALWRGPALANVRYEPFATAEVGRLEEARLVALELRIGADLVLGRHAHVVGELEGLVAEHPLREQLTGRLMTALYRSGRQADALRAYSRLRTALGEELGIVPGKALQLLETAIVRQDDDLDLPVADHQARPPAWLDVVTAEGVDRVLLTGDRRVVGKASENDIVITGDPTVSRIHAVLERQGPGWSLRDLDSRNGTYVNAELISTVRVLRDGDQLRMGRTSLHYRSARADGEDTQTATTGDIGAPALDADERVLLQMLGRPLIEGNVLSEPASIETVAAELGADPDDVRRRLDRLAERFAVAGPADLAGEAVRRGAITTGDLAE